MSSEVSPPSSLHLPSFFLQDILMITPLLFACGSLLNWKASHAHPVRWKSIIVEKCRILADSSKVFKLLKLRRVGVRTSFADIAIPVRSFPDAHGRLHSMHEGCITKDEATIS
jgi:hypothetical protein